MSSARDEIAVSGIGIQSIVPTNATRPVAKRKPEDDYDTDDTRTSSNHASPPSPPSPPPPGTGRVVDKVV
jgi:hypothetical protein